jgi:integrase
MIRGITQSELASFVGDTQQAVSDFLNKDANPQSKTRDKYFKKLVGFEDYYKHNTSYNQVNDPTLLLYIKFVAYNFLRPIEVNRLIIKNIDLKEKRIYFKAKNKQNFKIKRIPDILVNELLALNLDKYNPDDFLFTPSGIPGKWNRDDNGKREYYTGKFKESIKDKFNLGSEYGIYSFRHTYITNLFRTYRKTMPFNTAIEALMPITGHTSKEGLINYIHKIDADIPADWSADLEFIL